MSELQEVSIFNSDTQSDQMYVPNSRFQKLVALFKRRWILILLFALVFCSVILIVCRYEAQIQDLKESVDKNVDDTCDTLKNISQEIQFTEGKVAELESNFESQLDSIVGLVESVNEKLTNQSKEFSDKIEFQSRAASARSCRELHDHGFGTGKFRIDPDGRYGGVSSFEADCNFDHDPKGATVIHNTETIYSVTNNQTNLTPVKYAPSVKQIESLITNSGSCSQIIILLCHVTKKVNVNLERFWWVDKIGKYFSS